MFYLVGLGLSPKQITLEALEVLGGCEEVFVESYTNKYAQGELKELEDRIGKRIEVLGRSEVEQGFDEKIILGKDRDVALCVFGDALSATTHVQLLLDAKEKGVDVKVVHGISIFDYLADTGLDRYRFGRVCTIVRPEPSYNPESFYDVIDGNEKRGLHTLCLLDIKEDGKMMSISEGLEVLEGIQKRRKGNLISKAFVVGIAGAGSEEIEVRSGKVSEVKGVKFRGFPQTLIVCGNLTEKEMEALGVLG